MDIDRHPDKRRAGLLDRRRSVFRPLTLVGVLITLLVLASTAQPLGVRMTGADLESCGLPAGWSEPGGGRLAEPDLFDRLETLSVVLLGEQHDRMDHHLWQLEVLRELHQRGNGIVLALEMFPRRVQPALDAWVRGELTEAEFLDLSDWQRVWRFDPELYMGLFRYARDHGIAMQAVNVESTFTRAVGRFGFDAVPLSSREGVGKFAEPSPAYGDWLGRIHQMHPGGSRSGQTQDEQRRYFIEAQLTWDRAMAEGIRDALERHPGNMVVALIGSGHLRHGYGVPHQLHDLGIKAQASLLPWDDGNDCRELTRGFADAIYRFSPPTQPGMRAQLGVGRAAGDPGWRNVSASDRSAAIPPQAHADQAAPLHYRLELELDPYQRHLSGNAVVTVSTDAAFELWLNGGFQLQQASLNEAPLKPVRRRGEMTRIPIPAGSSGQTISLRWQGRLAATPLNQRHEDTLGWRMPSADPQGSFLPPSSLWYPLPLIGREVQPHSHVLRITTPPSQLGMSAGLPSGETGTAQKRSIEYHFPYPGRGIDLIAGPYQVAERHIQSKNGRPVVLRTLFHEPLTGLADDYLAALAEHITRFEHILGDYPYDSFSLVSSPTPTGFGMPGFTYLGIQVLRLPFIRDTSLAHEVLHSWWGNGVFPDYARGNWSEGLTTFMADYAHAERSSEDAARSMRLGWLRELSAIPPEADAPLVSFTARHHGVSQAIGYNRAAMVFLMLRQHIGESAFEEGLRRFWQHHRFETASWDDLIAAFEASAQQPLSDWFAQWLNRPGLPQLELAIHNEQNLLVTQTGEGWMLDVMLQVDHADGRELLCAAVGYTPSAKPWSNCKPARILNADPLRIIVDLSAYRQPVRVTLDPDNRMLRRLDQFEAPPVLRELQFANNVQFSIVGPRDIHPDAGTLATRLLDSQPRSLAAGTSPAPDSPLLVIGIQQDIETWLAQHKLPQTPAQVSHQGDVRMWTHRLPSGAPVAVIAADTPAALKRAMRPLPHYRQQSWLVLSNGQALQRGTWPTQPPGVTIGASTSAR